MPNPVVDLPGGGGNDLTLRTLLGGPSSPPPPPLAPPTLSGAPIVPSTPGQTVVLDSSGRLPSSAVATGLRMLTADPGSPKTGEFWYRTDTSQFCVQESAAVKRVTLS